MNNTLLAQILTGSGTEFFSSNGEANVAHNRSILKIEDAPISVTKPLFDFMTSDSERHNAYVKMAGDNVMDQMKQCVNCMFANLDDTPDLSSDGKITANEFVPCSKRFSCEFYGVGCNKLTADNGSEISKSELRVLEIYDMEEKEIADRLFLSPNTVRNHSQNIRLKTGIRKDKKLALWAQNKGLINQKQLCAY